MSTKETCVIEGWRKDRKITMSSRCRRRSGRKIRDGGGEEKERNK